MVTKTCDITDVGAAGVHNEAIVMNSNAGLLPLCIEAHFASMINAIALPSLQSELACILSDTVIVPMREVASIPDSMHDDRVRTVEQFMDTQLKYAEGIRLEIDEETLAALWDEATSMDEATRRLMFEGILNGLGPESQ